jgi:hypothetical protein
MGCRLLRQSTTITVDMGPALDATDGVTEETALSPTVYLSKAGAAQAARNSATAISHDARGYYRVELNTTDTNTLGMLRALFHSSATHLPVWEYFMVLPAVVYDSLVAGSDNLEVDTILWRGTQPNTLTSGRVEALVGAISSSVGLSTQQVTDLIAAFVTGGLITHRTTIGTVNSQTDLILAAGASSDNDAYNGAIVLFIDQSTAAQRSFVSALDYVGSTRQLLLKDAPVFTVAAGDTVVILRPSSMAGAKNDLDDLNDLSASGIRSAVGLASANLDTQLAAIAGYLDTEIASISSDLATLLSRLSATRAGYLDNLSAGAVAQASALSTVAGYLDTEIASLVTDMATLLSRLTSARAGYLDNLSAGAVAQASALSTVAGYLDTEIADLVTNMTTVLSRLTATRAGYLDNLSGGAAALNSDMATALTNLTTLLSRLTSARAGYLDNINNAALATIVNQTGDAYAALTGNRADPAALGAALGASLSPLLKIDWIAAAILRAGSFNKTTGDQVIKNSGGTDIAKATAADDGTTTSRGAYGAP